jgi:3'-phosphoadenosine 5'-phosphosulfate sulfotransferase (PAPS reductase)/FAD synthetase
MLFQWREGGYDGELLKEDALSAPITFEVPGAAPMTIGPGAQAEPATRRMFPFPGANLQTRWCSSTLKIEVAARALTNDPRFSRNVNVLFLTGERREESNNRAQYAEIIHHRSEALSYGRRIDQWRAILNWTEEEVWDAIASHRVRPHPAYSLGWSRVSCLPCIFGGPAQWRAVREIAPDVYGKLRAYEDQFAVEAHARADALEAAWAGSEPWHDILVRAREARERLKMARDEAGGTEEIDRAMVAADIGVAEDDLAIADKISQLRKFQGTIRPGGNIDEEAAKAEAKGENILVRDEGALALAMSERYPQDALILADGEEWRMPAGAFRKDSAGPT